jgi:hypothetical protein
MNEGSNKFDDVASMDEGSNEFDDVASTILRSLGFECV